MPVRLTNTADIIVSENRIRRNFNQKEIEDLANDIAKNGLDNPPTLRTIIGDTELSSSDDDTSYTLVAGERRLRAITQLQDKNIEFKCDGLNIKPGLCPFVLLEDISSVDALEIELHENLLRTDLDWRDEERARAQLHELRQKQVKDVSENTDDSAKTKPWTIKDTAKEVSTLSGTSQSHAERITARSVRLADHLDNPLLANAKSAKEAEKLVLRQIEGEFRAKLMEVQTDKDLNHRLILGDFRDNNLDLPENYFDLIIADPPYGIGAESFGDAAQTTHTYEDSRENAISVAGSILGRGYNLCRDKAHLFLFCDIDYFTDLRDWAENEGWKAFRTPLIWHRPGRGHIPWGPNSFRREHELILYCTKGEGAKLLELRPDVLEARPGAAVDQESGHAARKPVKLYFMLMIMTLIRGSGKILDPCCGSGPIFPAAEKEKHEAWGIEIDEDIYKLAATSLGRADEWSI